MHFLPQHSRDRGRWIFLSSRPAWSLQRFQDGPGCSETRLINKSFLSSFNNVYAGKHVFILFLIYFICLSIWLHMYVSVHHVCALPTGARRCPGAGVTDSCDPPCRCWESTQVRWAISPALGTDFVLFKDKISLYSLCWSRTQSIDQDGLELWDLSASATQVLVLKACVTTPGLGADF